jgi:aerobic carbon-monoxide dehydrogenase medium subunit
MYDTTYHRPSTVAEASALLAGNGDAKILAGGQTLIPTMKQRLAAPSAVIDIGRIGELKSIEIAGGVLSIGAGVTHAAVAASADIRAAVPALSDLAALIGDPHVRHLGTIGGSLANNDPAADYPAAVLALGGTIVTTSRSIPASDYFQGMFTTALADDEIIVGVRLPVPAKAAYAKFSNPASRYAMAGVFVAVLVDGSVRVGVTGAGSNGVFRWTEAEAALAAEWSPSALDGLVVDPSEMLSDIHGSAAYRANLVKVMGRRAVAMAG